MLIYCEYVILYRYVVIPFLYTTLPLWSPPPLLLTFHNNFIYIKIILYKNNVRGIIIQFFLCCKKEDWKEIFFMKGACKYG